MRVISESRLKEFWRIHPNSEIGLSLWLTRTSSAKWQNFLNLRESFSTADQVGSLTVFNISGNNYRLIARVNYKSQKVFIRSVLTHAEYDQENWKKDPWFKQ